ncbi:MAG TPA: sigma-70 family RNA polymerase sigma factor [Candidatus Acidoferrales bacterium]|nr:sigma-70 family RNA polymerase sigma factor [Candidatus Acidoferrales bacterium]
MGSSLTTRFPYLHAQKGADTNVSATAELRQVSDEYLLSRLRAGDAEALALLFGCHAKIVRHIGRRILRNDSEAEDLVQDLFLFLERKCAIFDSSKSSARSWIIQMAYQRAIERRRYLASRNFYAPAEARDEVERLVGKPTGESDYSPEEVFRRNGLEKALRTLSEEQRETIRLYFFDGYTLAEIAERLAQPLGNVRNHYYRGLNKLRKAMFRNPVRPVQPYGK